MHLYFKEPECGEGYEYVAQLSDGRTCHTALESAKGTFDTAVCDSPIDKLRKKYVPNSPYEVDRLKRRAM